ncbi:MAG: hypothetical protein L3J23_09805 [Flavobacteriaceae bacterium]|nr:hypothetical protein [Flavobacteriaceae bacterium]
MKTTYLIIGSLIIIVMASCKAQNNNLKQDTMKTFDIETFNKNKIGNEYNTVLEDSTVIKQYKSGSGLYIELIKPKNSYFQTRNRYYSNGKLKSTVQDFPNDFLAGVMKEYNQQGALIKETDYDKPFKFTFKDILKFIEQRNIDMKGDYFRIGRNVVDGTPVWGITYDKEKEKMILGTIGLDGITGEVIQEKDRSYPE